MKKIMIASVLMGVTFALFPPVSFAALNTLDGLTASQQFLATTSDATTMHMKISNSGGNTHLFQWDGIPWAVNQGGTGVTTSFTNGSVFFYSNGFAQDNGNLFWDFVNNALSIGTNSTSTPSKLTVKGSVGQSLLNVISTSGTSKLFVAESGNVSIGNSSPQHALDVSGAIYSRLASTTSSVDWNTANVQTITLTSNLTLVFSNGQAGGEYKLIVIQDEAGGRTTTWPVSVMWPNGVSPTLSAAANTKNLFNFVYDGNNYLGYYFDYSSTTIITTVLQSDSTWTKPSGIVGNISVQCFGGGGGGGAVSGKYGAGGGGGSSAFGTSVLCGGGGGGGAVGGGGSLGGGGGGGGGYAIKSIDPTTLGSTVVVKVGQGGGAPSISDGGSGGAGYYPGGAGGGGNGGGAGGGGSIAAGSNGGSGNGVGGSGGANGGGGGGGSNGGNGGNAGSGGGTGGVGSNGGGQGGGGGGGAANGPTYGSAAGGGGGLGVNGDTNNYGAGGAANGGDDNPSAGGGGGNSPGGNGGNKQGGNGGNGNNGGNGGDASYIGSGQNGNGVAGAGGGTYSGIYGMGGVAGNAGSAGAGIITYTAQF